MKQFFIALSMIFLAIAGLGDEAYAQTTTSAACIQLQEFNPGSVDVSGLSPEAAAQKIEAARAALQAACQASLNVIGQESAQLNSEFSQTCPRQGIFTERIVHCVKTSMETALTQYLQLITDFARPTVIAVCTLAVILFGLKMLMGEQGVSQRLIGLVFRLAIVVWLADNLGGLTPYIFGSMEDIQSIVTSTLMEGSSHCPGLSGDSAVWKRLDCLMGRLFGFGPGGAIATGMVGLLSASIFSGTAGVSMFVAAGSAMMMVMTMAFRAVITFLLAYTSVTFLIMLSPFIVLFLMFQPTMSYFFRWLQMLVASMLEPIILFAFIAMFFGIMEQIIFDGSNSLDKAMTDVSQFYKQGSNTDTTVNVDQKAYGRIIPDKLDANGQPIRSGPVDMSSVLNTTKLDAGQKTVEKLVGLAQKATGLTLTAYVMLQVMATIPKIAGQMVGMSSFVSASSMSEMPMRAGMQKRMEQTTENMRTAVAGSGGGTKGAAAFLGQALPAIVMRR